MIKLVIIQNWVKEYFPEHYEYKVCIYREDTFIRGCPPCESKAETVSFVNGLEIAFEMSGEKCEVEFVDDSGEPGNYYEYFFPENFADNGEHYLESTGSRGDREDFHSDG